MQVGGRLLIATHLDQSNYLASQKQGQVKKLTLTVSIGLFPRLSFKGSQQSSSGLFTGGDSTYEPHPRFPVQDHILNIGGDALLHYKFERNKHCM
jgi:hypothetical protein